MNSKPVDTIATGESLALPEPDPDNITVLTRNLPNKPIIPWSHYDSPWRDADEEVEKTESEEPGSSELGTETENLEPNAENLDEASSIQDNTEAISGDEIAAEETVDEETVDQAQELDEQPGLTQLEQLEETEHLEETPTDELTG